MEDEQLASPMNALVLAGDYLAIQVPARYDGIGKKKTFERNYWHELINEGRTLD